MEHILLNVFNYGMTSVLLVLPIHSSTSGSVCVCVRVGKGGWGGDSVLMDNEAYC